jgi:hypothetical protein
MCPVCARERERAQRVREVYVCVDGGDRVCFVLAVEWRRVGEQHERGDATK